MKQKLDEIGELVWDVGMMLTNVAKRLRQIEDRLDELDGLPKAELQETKSNS